MTIYTVVYVGDGVLHDVDVFTDRTEADARYNELSEEEGGSLESLGYITEDEIGGYCQEWGEEVHVVNGKHYIVNEADCLRIDIHEIEDTKCVWIPDEEVIEQKLGRKPTDLEVGNIQHAFEKGIEGQVDWEMAFACAIEQV